MSRFSGLLPSAPGPLPSRHHYSPARPFRPCKNDSPLSEGTRRSTSIPRAPKPSDKARRRNLVLNVTDRPLSSSMTQVPAISSPWHLGMRTKTSHARKWPHQPRLVCPIFILWRGLLRGIGLLLMTRESQWGRPTPPPDSFDPYRGRGRRVSEWTAPDGGSLTGIYLVLVPPPSSRHPA